MSRDARLFVAALLLFVVCVLVARRRWIEPGEAPPRQAPPPSQPRPAPPSGAGHSHSSGGQGHANAASTTGPATSTAPGRRPPTPAPLPGDALRLCSAPSAAEAFVRLPDELREKKLKSRSTVYYSARGQRLLGLHQRYLSAPTDPHPRLRTSMSWFNVRQQLESPEEPLQESDHYLSDRELLDLADQNGAGAQIEGRSQPEVHEESYSPTGDEDDRITTQNEVVRALRLRLPDGLTLLCPKQSSCRCERPGER